MTDSRILIRHGQLVDTEPQPAVLPDTDVLIEDGAIAAVGTDLPVPAGATVVDASDRIVLPGFVDTHRHTWQVPLRMVAPDTTLQDYLRVVGERAQRFRPEDVRAANLAGALECLNSGITTLVDWTLPGADNLAASVEGLTQAGIRAYVGCGRADIGDFPSTALLRPAVAAGGPEYASPEEVRADWTAARSAGALLMTHLGGFGAESAQRGMDVLENAGLLGPMTLYVHANAVTDKAFRLIAESGGSISVTPAIEPAMGHGHPVTGRALAAGAVVGLGIDVVTSGPGDMFSVMRAAYLLERSRNAAFTTADALRLATIDGARAIGLSDQVGSLRAGKQADLVLLRKDWLGLAAAADPISAIVLSADTSAVDTVLVGGRILKQDSRFVDQDLSAVVAEVALAADRLL